MQKIGRLISSQSALVRLAAIVFLLFSTGACAMGLLGEKVYLFSEVKGVITLNNKPVKGARIIRTVEWKDDTYVDEATTAEDGSFTLPLKKGKGRILLAEFVAYQTMEVEYEDQKWLIWRTIKRNELINGELVDRDHPDGMPIIFECELSDKQKLFGLRSAVLRTRCSFFKKIGEELPLPENDGNEEVTHD